MKQYLTLNWNQTFFTKPINQVWKPADITKKEQKKERESERQ
jgi:hypothetical protein